MKISFRILVVLILLAWVIITLSQEKTYREIITSQAEKEIERVPVTTIKIVRENPGNTLRLAGKVASTNEIMVTSSVAGELKEVFVTPGTRVVKGQILATVDDYYLQEQFTLAEKSYEQDKNDLNRPR